MSQSITSRKIIHVDMDAFYASVEQRDNLALRGKPVVVAWRGKRSVVCAASYEARKYGIRSAMPALRAERLCPKAIFVPPDFSRYRSVSKHVREIFSRYTDRIEPLSLDEAYLDVTENLCGLPSATAVAEAIRADIRSELSLIASAGVAPNKFLAKIASDWRKPDGLFVIKPEHAIPFLSTLPLGRLPGIGKVTERKLAHMGYNTVGEIRDISLTTLEAEFGSWGRRLHELSFGVDNREVESDHVVHSVSSEDTFDRDHTLDELDEIIAVLAKKTWQAAQKTSRLARTVVLKLKTSDFQILTRNITPSAPPSSSEKITQLALQLRERVDLPIRTRYRLVGVGLSNFVDPQELSAQSLLLGQNKQLTSFC